MPESAERSAVAAPMPTDLAETVRRAIACLDAEDHPALVELLGDAEDRTRQGITVEQIVASITPVNALLLKGTLDRVLTLEPRITPDGELAVFDLSETACARFSKSGGEWKLSDFRGLDPTTRGIGYDNAPRHAVFLLEKLTGREAVVADETAGIDERERRLLRRLISLGAGVAVTSSKAERRTAVVLRSDWQGNEEDFGRLKELGGLQVLALYGVPLPDAALWQLAEFPHLEHLRLISESIREETLAGLSLAGGLKSLSLIGGRERTVRLAPLRKLQRLDLLELIELQFPEDDLQRLKDLPRLRRLDLTFSTLTDAGLRHLHDFPALESVRLSPVSMTVEALQELQQARPGLYIDW